MRPLLFVFWAAFALAQSAPDLSGIWLGNLDAGAVSLRTGLNFRRLPHGSYSATFDSYDQGALDIPVEQVKVDGRHVYIEAPALQATYDAELSADGKTLKGTFKQRGISLPLTLTRAEHKPELTRPQEPKPPFPYRSEEVTYKNTKSDVKLAGTLTLPSDAGPFPAVLLLTGSGAQDRNETIFGHKPFLLIADYLTRRGIAVLRVDDRGVGGSTGSTADATKEDLADDALAGVAFLRARSDIASARVGLIGHSEGADVAALAASRSPDIAFIVMLAGTGLPGEEMLRSQAEAIMRASGATDEQIRANSDLQREMFAIVRQETDRQTAERKLREALTDYAKRSGMSTADRERLVETQLRATMSPALRSIILADPSAALKKVGCPVLAMNGSRDLQVVARVNLPAIAAALAQGNNPDYEIVELPMLNHMFQKATTGLVTEYAQIDQTFAPEALEIIAAWLQRHMQ